MSPSTVWLCLPYPVRVRAVKEVEKGGAEQKWELGLLVGNTSYIFADTRGFVFRDMCFVKGKEFALLAADVAFKQVAESSQHRW